jgi:hypothetical protein
MRKIFLIAILFLCWMMNSSAQQVMRARHVKLVTTTSASAGLQIVCKGGVTFIGNTTSFMQNGNLTLLSNPVSGNSDWLDSTTGVISAASLGMVNFNGTTVLQQLTGPTTFYGLTVQGMGINQNQSNEVRGLLNLNNGLIYIPNTNDSLYVSNAAIAAISYDPDSFATTSWVHGKLSRKMNIASPSAYFFPIGKIKSGNNLYAPIILEKSNTANVVWSAQYFPATPFNRTAHDATIDHVSSLEYWEISSHNYVGSTDDDATLSLSWRTYSQVNPSAAVRDSLLVAQYFDDFVTGLMWHPRSILPATLSAGNSVNWGFLKSIPLSDFTDTARRFSLATRSINNALPLKLLDYWVTLSSNNIVTNYWKIIDDREVHHYEVERSIDGSHFNFLASVQSIRTPNTTDYNVVDNHPFTGWNYYRLKIVADGNRIKYSETRKVYIGDKGIFTIYPNPAQQYLYINLPAMPTTQTSLQLIDVSGRIISTIRPQSSLVRLSLESLAAGSYFIRYSDGRNVVTKPFIHAQ